MQQLLMINTGRCAKNDIRLARGDAEESCRVHLKGIDQKMLRGTVWNVFFHNGEDKEDLIALVSHFQEAMMGGNL